MRKERQVGKPVNEDPDTASDHKLSRRRSTKLLGVFSSKRGKKGKAGSHDEKWERIRRVQKGTSFR